MNVGIGDLVVPEGLTGDCAEDRAEVVGIHTFGVASGGSVEFLWLKQLNGRMLGVRMASLYRKYDPRFEVGRVYRCNVLRVLVVAVSRDDAMGWTSGGQTWSRSHSTRELWEEITDHAVVADTRTRLRNMGIDPGGAP